MLKEIRLIATIMYFYFVLCCFLGFTSKNKYVNRYSFSSDYDWERWTYRVYIYFKRKLSISGKCFGRPSNFYTTEKISLVWKQFEKQKEKEREGAAIWTKKKSSFVSCEWQRKRELEKKSRKCDIERGRGGVGVRNCQYVSDILLEWPQRKLACDSVKMQLLT